MVEEKKFGVDFCSKYNNQYEVHSWANVVNFILSYSWLAWQQEKHTGKANEKLMTENVKKLFSDNIRKAPYGGTFF